MNLTVKFLSIVFCFLFWGVSSANQNILQKDTLEVKNVFEYYADKASSPKHILLAQNYKTRKSGQSAKDAATDIPSWAAGEKPFVGESGSTFAKRLLDDKYPDGGYPTGPGSEYNKIKKYGDRAFE